MDLLHDCLSFRLASGFRHVDRMLNRMLAPLGLTHAHTQVLACLLAADELRVTDIAARTGFEQSTVSRLVKALARRKLLRSRRHPEDGRATLYRPGVRAEALRSEIRAILGRADERLHREVPKADVGPFLSTLQIMENLL